MITAGLTVSYKRDLLQGVHQPDDVYKMALYTEDAELSPATTHYTATEEVDEVCRQRRRARVTIEEFHALCPPRLRASQDIRVLTR